MIPVDFEDSNITLGPPPGMTDEECATIKAYHHPGSAEVPDPYYLVAMKPSKEDIDAINRGDLIYFQVWGSGFAPMCAYTLDENGKANV